MLALQLPEHEIHRVGYPDQPFDLPGVVVFAAQGLGENTTAAVGEMRGDLAWPGVLVLRSWSFLEQSHR
jgi:hypothetical protein